MEVYKFNNLPELWLGLCLLEEALAYDRKATLSDVSEEDDVFWMSCSKTNRLLYKSSLTCVNILLRSHCHARLSHRIEGNLKTLMICVFDLTHNQHQRASNCG
ncbi:hypothetical protein Tco_1311727 [Tanacetum coccineum]